MTASRACEPGKFQCVSTGYCIDEDLKCDGRAACEDASDEADCRKFMFCVHFNDKNVKLITIFSKF